MQFIYFKIRAHLHWVVWRLRHLRTTVVRLLNVYTSAGKRQLPVDMCKCAIKYKNLEKPYGWQYYKRFNISPKNFTVEQIEFTILAIVL